MEDTRLPFMAEISGAFTPQQLAEIITALNAIYWLEGQHDHIWVLADKRFIPEQNESVFSFLTTIYETVLKRQKNKKERADVRTILQHLAKLEEYSLSYGLYPAMQHIANSLGLNYEQNLYCAPQKSLLKECRPFSWRSRENLLRGLARAIISLVIQHVNPAIVTKAIKDNVRASASQRRRINSLLRLYKIAADASIVMGEVPSYQAFIEKGQYIDHREGLLLGYDKFYAELHQKIVSADLEEIKKRYERVLGSRVCDAQMLLEDHYMSYIARCPKLELHELTTEKSVRLLKTVYYDAKCLDTRIMQEFQLECYPPPVGPRNTFAHCVSPALDVIQVHILRCFLFEGSNYVIGEYMTDIEKALMLHQIIDELAKADDIRHQS